MNIYLISQTVNNGYDTFDSAVVIAETPRKAQLTHPYETTKNWDGEDEQYSAWCAADDVNVEFIGTETTNIPRVVCASFNAG